MEHGSWRGQVGPIHQWDEATIHQFRVITGPGNLRSDDTIADIGCGCLRVGRLLIPYLEAAHYFGVDPDEELVSAGVMHETGPGLASLKMARFTSRTDFNIVDQWPQITWRRILAHDLIPHLDDPQRQQFLEQIAYATNRDTETWLTFASAETDAIVEFAGRTTVELAPATLRSEADAVGLKLTIQSKTKHYADQTWATLTRRR